MLSWWKSGVLDPQGPVGAAERLILLDATAIMLAIVVPVILMTLAVAWWFRSGNARAQHLPDWEYSGPVELVVWSIPALVVMFLGGIAWIGSHDLDPPKRLTGTGKPVEIQVVALDWKWLFIYPEEGVASVNRVVVPVGAPLHFTITSASVMNSFFVPQLGSQIYAMGGMTTELNLRADKPGTYPGVSAQFSGDGFSDMRFELVAMPPQGFDDWLGKTKVGARILDAAGYSRLSRPGTIDQPTTYAAIVPNVFEAIIRNTVK
ncbi:MAG TPA: ubiquinol oxidase subunit II [Reyranella sp.]|nr:ubiquinol oxidase subunit II [Reyranella sp.]